MYDYDKADSDEISLREGDMICDGEIVGEGWMEGTNMRTGETGMLPSNYVEKVWTEHQVYYNYRKKLYEIVFETECNKKIMCYIYEKNVPHLEYSFWR